MNNLFSYYELVDARISASEKDLPVTDLLSIAFTKLPCFFQRMPVVHLESTFVVLVSIQFAMPSGIGATLLFTSEEWSMGPTS